MGSSRQSVNSPESDELASRKQSTRKEVVNSAAENGQPASNGVYFFLLFASKRSKLAKPVQKRGKQGKIISSSKCCLQHPFAGQNIQQLPDEKYGILYFMAIIVYDEIVSTLL